MKVQSDINVTPYIDILLVLLIIFLIIQPVDQYDLEARVPDKPPDVKKLPEQGLIFVTDSIVVSVETNAGLKINGEPVTLDQLGSRLFRIYSARSNKNMFIRGARDLPFAAIVKVIDVAKGSGVGDIGLVTEEEIQSAG